MFYYRSVWRKKIKACLVTADGLAEYIKIDNRTKAEILSQISDVL